MSKTFASRSTSVNTRGRGGSTSRSVDRGQVAGQRVESTPQVDGLRGRGGRQAGGPGPVTRSKSRSTSGNTSTSRSTTTTAKKMYNNSRIPQDNERQQQSIQEETSQASSQQAKHTPGAFTMFQPNMKKRQQVNEMAQRETAAYERYKQSTKPRNFNFVGTAGGGIAEETARNRQSNENRLQKMRRQQRQEEHRLTKREAEQRDIDTMRREARRKADQNELRGTTPDPEDLRRRREAFLNRFENQGTD